MDTVLFVLNAFVSGFVLWWAICATNKMDKNTRFLIRVGFILIGVGAASCMIYPLWHGQSPEPTKIFMLLGLAALAAGNKRKQVTA